MVMNLNENNFDKEVLESTAPVLVDFWAPWCGPCQMMGPIIEDIATTSSNVKICKLNVEDFQKLAVKYKVMSIPTVVLFNNHEEVTRIVGLSSKEEVMGLLDNK